MKFSKIVKALSVTLACLPLALNAAEQKIMLALIKKNDELVELARLIIVSKTVNLEIAASLEDMGNNFLELSESISVSNRRRSRLRSVK